MRRQTTNVNLVFIHAEFDLLPQNKPSRATAQYSTCTALKIVAVTCIVVAADLLNIQDYSSKISRRKDVSSSNSTAPVAPRYLRVHDRSFCGCVKQPSKSEHLSVKK